MKHKKKKMPLQNYTMAGYVKTDSRQKYIPKIDLTVIVKKYTKTNKYYDENFHFFS